MISKNKKNKGLARGRPTAEGITRHDAGFTLVETLIAVLILSIAIAGPLTIASKGLNAALVAKNQTTAAFLAQDAMEYLRFARDTNRLEGQDWLNGPAASDPTTLKECISPKTCYLDSTAQNPTSPRVCGGSTCGVMNYDATNHVYNYDNAATPTIFTRTIEIITQAANTEVTAKVTVSWKDAGGVARQVVVQENMFNWQ